jgi:hypothetical protein
MPIKMVFYREGLCESMSDRITAEIWQIKESLKEMKEELKMNNEIKFIYILVNKRNKARFYNMNRQNFENPQVGTVVQGSITQ